MTTQHWRMHIEEMKELRRAVSLQSYGQGKPLVIYQEEAFKKFNEMNESITKNTSILAIRAQIQPKAPVPKKAPSKPTQA